MPTPRFEVGAVLLAAQLLVDKVQTPFSELQSCHIAHLHGEWEH